MTTKTSSPENLLSSVDPVLNNSAAIPSETAPPQTARNRLPCPSLRGRHNAGFFLAECGEEAASLAREAGVPPLIAELLFARGIGTAAEADAFLNPRIDHLLDPYSMLGMDRAVERIQRAIAAREPVFIYGDYDVDGTTATVLLKTAIEMLGGEARFHIPHRLREGYGMQREILENAREGRNSAGHQRRYRHSRFRCC